MKQKILLIASYLLFVPAISQAALLDLTSSDLLGAIKNLVNGVIPIMIGIALVFFIYALLGFILKAGEAKDEARSQMVYGIIILAVIVGVWGLVNALLGAFGIVPSSAPMSATPGI